MKHHKLFFTLMLSLFVSIVMYTKTNAQWMQVLEGLSENSAVFAITVSGTNLFAGTSVDGVFLSTDDGTSWTEVNSGLTDTRVHAIVVSGANLFAGTLGGVFLSTDNGTSWTEVNSGLTDLNLLGLTVNATNLFAGTFDGGVFLSTDNGTSWTAVNSGLTNLMVLSLTVSGANLFAGTLGFEIGSGVWRRPLSEIITSVDETTSNEIPTVYSLQQNYPNPFNPMTIINYSIPELSIVTIKVYGVLGSEIATLVNEEKPVGTYEVEFDAATLSSGIYYYKIQANNFIETKKMILLK